MDSVITQEQVVAALKNSDAASLAKNSGLVASLTKVLTASLRCAEDALKPGGMATCLAEKAASATSVFSEAVGTPVARAASFVVNQSASTIGLLSMTQYTSPAKAATFVTLQMASKIVGVAELTQLDNCKTAVAALVVSTGSGALACGVTLGVGCLASAIVVAGESFNVYGQCRKKTGDGS